MATDHKKRERIRQVTIVILMLVCTILILIEISTRLIDEIDLLRSQTISIETTIPLF